MEPSKPLLLVHLVHYSLHPRLNHRIMQHKRPRLHSYQCSTVKPILTFRPKTHLTWAETVPQIQADDQRELSYLSSLSRAVHYADMAMNLCSGCVACGSSALLLLNPPLFASLNCAAAQCNTSSIAANLAQDNLTLATDSIVGYSFGCIQKAVGGTLPPQGVLGLGRGSLSLLSQSKSLYKSTFSYCLPSFKSPNFSGTLRLGPNGQPKNIKYTPLLTNPRRPSLYYVKLVGIKVGPKLVNIPASAFALNPNNGAGTIIDSGTVFTRLVTPAYTAVRDEFRRRMGKNVVSSLGGIVHEAGELPDLQLDRWHYVPSHVCVTVIERDRQYATTKS
ncbi:aspartyl protease AED3-like protein [Tanacetum coccineum]